MARYPGAEYRPLGTQTEPRMSAHNILCFHTMVGSLAGTGNYFDYDGYYGVESHFGVGGSTDGARDGHVIQWQDTAYCADANLDGKSDVLSVETSDGGDPNRPWSAKALDSLVALGVWACRTHNIPPVLIPDTKPGRRGLAYHRQGCDHSSSYRPKGWPYDAWRVPGGVRWSKAVGKTCPGDVRIRQLIDVVIPRIQAALTGGGGAAPTPSPGDDMALIRVPKGGSADKPANFPLAMSMLFEHDVIIAPGRLPVVLYDAYNWGWTGDDDKDMPGTGGNPVEGAKTQVIHVKGSYSFIAPKGTGKTDLVYWADDDFTVAIERRA